MVKRPEKVVVKALNENGQSIEFEGTGLMARALCHEIDHLEGVLFIDKVISGTIIKQNKYQRLKVNYHIRACTVNIPQPKYCH